MTARGAAGAGPARERAPRRPGGAWGLASPGGEEAHSGGALAQRTVRRACRSPMGGHANLAGHCVGLLSTAPGTQSPMAYATARRCALSLPSPGPPARRRAGGAGPAGAEAEAGEEETLLVTRIIFDTDIGTDVDDCLALALILGSPELRLEAVTCVYGDVALRAQMVLKLLRLAGRPEVPVALGASRPPPGAGAGVLARARGAGAAGAGGGAPAGGGRARRRRHRAHGDGQPGGDPPGGRGAPDQRRRWPSCASPAWPRTWPT